MKTLNQAIQERTEDLARAITRKRKDLETYVDRFRQSLFNLSCRIQNGATLNPLGEIQTQGPTIDIEIMDLCRMEKELKELNAILQNVS